ncbi:MAG: hypothetical protein ACQKBV_06455, partial [Puniceicoccales bacterium]
ERGDGLIQFAETAAQSRRPPSKMQVAAAWFLECLRQAQAQTMARRRFRVTQVSSHPDPKSSIEPPSGPEPV